MPDTPISLRDPLAGLSSLADMLGGRASTENISGATTTTTNRANYSPELVQQMLDQAMRSQIGGLNLAEHTAGMYGSTGLALGKQQVMQDAAIQIAKETAGTTTTSTNSGQTRTTTQGGVASNPTGYGGALALKLLGDPASKWLDKTGIVKKIQGFISPDETAGSSLDSIVGPSGVSLGDQTAAENSLSFGATSTPSINFDPSSLLSDVGATDTSYGIPDLFGSGATDATSSALADGTAGSLVDSTGSSIIDNIAPDVADTGVTDLLSSIFSFKDGGMVRGYADGGTVAKQSNYLDSPSSPTVNQTVDPVAVLLASGSSDPNVKLDLRTGLPVTASTTTGTTTKPAATPRATTSDVGGAGGGPSPGGISGLASFGLSALGPLGSVIGAVTGTPSVQGQAISAIAGVLGLGNSGPGEGIGQGEGIGATVGGTGTGGSLGIGSGTGLGGADGGDGSGIGGDGGAGSGIGGDGYDSGGTISGPGTGTSDSVTAKLSNGETVITAQTTAKMRQAFGDDVFNKLEQAFNPQAARVQVQKGRV